MYLGIIHRIPRVKPTNCVSGGKLKLFYYKQEDSEYIFIYICIMIVLCHNVMTNH